MRRFALHHEVMPLTRNECFEMINLFLSTVDMRYDQEDITRAVDILMQSNDKINQSHVMNYIVEKIANTIINQETKIALY